MLSEYFELRIFQRTADCDRKLVKATKYYEFPEDSEIEEYLKQYKGDFAEIARTYELADFQ